MSQERRDILEMLAAGKITAEEAERLIAAVERTSTDSSSATAAEPSNRPKPKYLRVVVNDVRGKDGGPVNVNVRVPMQLLRAGVRLAGLIPQPAMEKANIAMGHKGVHIDLGSIKPENLDELVDQLNDLTVEMDEGKGKVRVFCE
jgi:hypothetical protein